jgi:predicted nucleic acid-binding protein
MGTKRRLVRTVVLDATALEHVTTPHTRAAQFVRRCIAKGADVVVPATALAEVLRGHPRDANVMRYLNSTNVIDVTREVAASAGRRIGKTRSRGNVTLDAIVATIAAPLARPVVILTGDMSDLTALVDPDVMVLDIAA